MRDQKIAFTALPPAPGTPPPAPDRLRVSVHVAPRLQTDEDLPVPRLTQFPDLLDWPATVAGVGWTVRLGGNAVPAEVVSEPRSDLWRALFAPETFVRPYAFPDLHDRKVRSYPVGHVEAFLTERYRTVATTAPTEYPGYQELVDAGLFGQLHPGRDGGRRLMEQIEEVLTQQRAVPPGPADPPRDFLQLRRFHAPRGAAVVELAPPELDFHDVLALVLDHPALLRLLGLVVDLDVPTELLAGVPAASELSVVPAWSPALTAAGGTHTDQTPRTRCALSGGALVAAPRPGAPDLVGGHLPVGDPDRYTVVRIDPDGAAIKTMDLVANLAASRQHSWTGQPEAYAVPTLRSAGFSVARTGRAAALVAALQRSKQLHDAAQGGQGLVLDAEDLVRGHRVDVFDEAAGRWYPLHARVGRYTVPGTGIELLVTDEGALTTTPTSAADGSSPDLYLQESLFQWLGWSLAAPPPGTSITPDEQIGTPENKAATAYPLEVRFTPRPGTLPRLRFGRSYRFRMRAVDLAGNSVPFDATTAPAAPVATPALPYLRYEPVAAPVLVLRQPRTEGESVAHMVIRSNFDTAATAESQRHVVPPQSAQLTAEQHGRFDTPAQPGQPSVLDPAAWALITEREHRDLDTSPQVSWETDGIKPHPYYDVDQLDLPYLPDPIARGATFLGLPGGSVAPVKVPFTPEPGKPWYALRPLRVVLAEGPAHADFDDATRVLRVSLPKGETSVVRVSCNLTDADLSLLGIWQLIESANLPAGVRQGLAAAALDGRHWMLTPYVELTLVHAVRQPLLTPEPVGWTPTRAAGQTHATLDGVLHADRRSTSRLDVLAQWPERVDGGPGAPPPHTRTASAAVANHTVAENPAQPESVPISDRHEFGDTRYRRVTYRAVATSRFSKYFTRRQWLSLTGTDPVVLDPAGLVPGSVVVADAAGEYAEGRDYVLDPDAGTIARSDPSHLAEGAQVSVEYLAAPITRDSTTPVVLDIPSAARPAAPVVRHAVPTFRWTEQRTSTLVTSGRQGSGLRVYLERPWWSSGDGELLGVVLERNPGAPKTSEVRDRLRSVVTLCGEDPVYATAGLAATALTPAMFPLAAATGTNLALAGAPENVDVVGHAVAFDPDRDLWYCDVDVNVGPSYLPFVRLALVRYQPHSLPGLHLSPVALVDFTQLPPDRLTTVQVTSDTTVKVTVSGPSYRATTAAAGPSLVIVTPEVRDPVVGGALGWLPAGAPGVPVTLGAQQQPNGHTVWQGTVTLPPVTQRGARRLVVEEFERVAASAGGDGAGVANRLVHTDLIVL
ncbi:hypothetical protein AB0J86_18985 [Micromonospora sp. NPDC049559]|uniref:hypothetical protein n=1 Tax=Micromonospora sp. NPDC049559 TaxID=3155923 RepID=UPI003417C046